MADFNILFESCAYDKLSPDVVMLTSPNPRWLLPKEGVQYSYIVTDDIGEELVDFFSFHITSFNTPDDIEGLKEAEKSNTREIKAVVPGYLTTKNTRRDDIG